MVAVDGRLALRWPRDFRGDVAHQLIVALGFIQQRPYDLKVLGDLTADSDVMDKLAMLHPVQSLTSPNAMTFEQLGFPQAAADAELSLIFGPVAPRTGRIPRLMTLFWEDWHEVSRQRVLARRAARARAVWVLSVELGAVLRRVHPALTIEVLPLAPTVLPPRELSPHPDSYLLVPLDSSLRPQFAHLFAILAPLGLPVRLLVSDRQTETAAMQEVERLTWRGSVEPVAPADAAAISDLWAQAAGIYAVGEGDAAVLAALNGWASGVPVAADDSDVLRHRLAEGPVTWLSRDPKAAHESLTQLVHPDPDAIVAGRRIATQRSWRAAGEMVDRAIRGLAVAHL